MIGGVFPTRTGAFIEAWAHQAQALEDLTAFVRLHGPSAGRPLPVLGWRVGAFRSVSAELPAGDPHVFETLGAYARVLGARVATRTEGERVVCVLRGRLGERDGESQLPRTMVTIRAVTRRLPDDQTAGGV